VRIVGRAKVFTHIRRPDRHRPGNSSGVGAVGDRMTSTADATISALRSTHDELAAVVRGLTDEQLLDPSGASEWPVAQVLSHLGSGAEIGRATLAAATGEGEAPGDGFNQSVWDRWNAMSPRQQADAFLESDEASVAAFEALTAEERSDVEVALGFLPRPLPLAAYAGMRLNEAAQHSWDVRVAHDEAAAIADDTASLVVEHYATGLGFMLGFIGKADALGEPALVTLGDLDVSLSVTDSVALVPTNGAAATAALVGPPDAVARLLAGRLTPRWTPDGVSVAGNVDLDDLRRVFPGY
jgi:uncharacterized protein (TIGR03083 family)